MTDEWVVIYIFDFIGPDHPLTLDAGKSIHDIYGDRMVHVYGPFKSREVAESYHLDYHFGSAYKKEKVVTHMGDPYEMGLS